LESRAAREVRRPERAGSILLKGALDIAYTCDSELSLQSGTDILRVIDIFGRRYKEKKHGR
jgi:hypothetical protein